MDDNKPLELNGSALVPLSDTLILPDHLPDFVLINHISIETRVVRIRKIKNGGYLQYLFVEAIEKVCVEYSSFECAVSTYEMVEYDSMDTFKVHYEIPSTLLVELPHHCHFDSIEQTHIYAKVKDCYIANPRTLFIFILFEISYKPKHKPPHDCDVVSHEPPTSYQAILDEIPSEEISQTKAMFEIPEKGHKEIPVIEETTEVVTPTEVNKPTSETKPKNVFYRNLEKKPKTKLMKVKSIVSQQ